MAAPEHTSSATILVVADDPDVRELAVQFLTGMGIPVLEAASGAEALTLLASHPEIGVLFSDVCLPGMNGAELAARARRRWPELRIVMTSAYVAGIMVRDVEFLPKPYRMHELVRKLVGMLKIE